MTASPEMVARIPLLVNGRELAPGDSIGHTQFWINRRLRRLDVDALVADGKICTRDQFVAEQKAAQDKAKAERETRQREAATKSAIEAEAHAAAQAEVAARIRAREEGRIAGEIRRVHERIVEAQKDLEYWQMRQAELQEAS